MSQQGASRARRVVSKPLAELVNRALDPLIARRGFGEATLLTQWDMIVGARIGALCQPMRLNWPPRPKNGSKNGAPDAAQQPATLALRVEPGFGLDIQHMSGAIIERVNTHLGWRCVAKLAIRQEPLAPRRAESAAGAAERPRRAGAGRADDARRRERRAAGGAEHAGRAGFGGEGARLRGESGHAAASRASNSRLRATPQR